VICQVHLCTEMFALGSVRDIYYNDVQLFGSQRTVDFIVEDVSCLLKVPRRSLHVVCAYGSSV